MFCSGGYGVSTYKSYTDQNQLMEISNQGKG